MDPLCRLDIGERDRADPAATPRRRDRAGREIYAATEQAVESARRGAVTGCAARSPGCAPLPPSAGLRLRTPSAPPGTPPGGSPIWARFPAARRDFWDSPACRTAATAATMATTAAMAATPAEAQPARSPGCMVTPARTGRHARPLRHGRRSHPPPHLKPAAASSSPNWWRTPCSTPAPAPRSASTSAGPRRSRTRGADRGPLLGRQPRLRELEAACRPGKQFFGPADAPVGPVRRHGRGPPAPRRLPGRDGF